MACQGNIAHLSMFHTLFSIAIRNAPAVENAFAPAGISANAVYIALFIPICAKKQREKTALFTGGNNKSPTEHEFSWGALAQSR